MLVKGATAGFDKQSAVDKESYDKFDATVILETGFHENNTIFSIQWKFYSTLIVTYAAMVIDFVRNITFKYFS